MEKEMVKHTGGTNGNKTKNTHTHTHIQRWIDARAQRIHLRHMSKSSAGKRIFNLENNWTAETKQVQVCKTTQHISS